MKDLPSHLRKKPVEAWSREDWSTIYHPMKKTSYAHTFAEQQALPPGFSHWDIRDAENDTVAHVAARKGALPGTFDQWSLVNDMGWTVSHCIASKHAHLFPSTFDQWALLVNDGTGISVLDLIIMTRQSLPDTFRAFDYRNVSGEDIMTIAANHNNGAVLAQLEARRIAVNIDHALSPAFIRKVAHEC